MTDVRKAANRVSFNQPEEEVLDGDEVRLSLIVVQQELTHQMQHERSLQ